MALVGMASGSRHKGFDHPTWPEEQVPQPPAPSKGVLGSPGERGLFGGGGGDTQQKAVTKSTGSSMGRQAQGDGKAIGL